MWQLGSQSETSLGQRRECCQVSIQLSDSSRGKWWSVRQTRETCWGMILDHLASMDSRLRSQVLRKSCLGSLAPGQRGQLEREAGHTT